MNSRAMRKHQLSFKAAAIGLLVLCALAALVLWRVEATRVPAAPLAGANIEAIDRRHQRCIEALGQSKSRKR